MTTKIQLWNMAMAHIGGRQTFTEGDNSAEDRVCAVFNQVALDQVVSDADWSFATSHATINGCVTMQSIDDTTFSALNQVSEVITMAKDTAIAWSGVSTSFVGTIILQKSIDDEVTWTTVTGVTAVSASVAETNTTLSTYAKYRWKCSAYTSGSIVMSLRMLGTDRWRYQYALPSDCLLPRFLAVYPFHGRRMPPLRMPFDLADNGNGTTVLYTDNYARNDDATVVPDALVLVYTKQITDVTRFPSWIILCLSRQLSLLCAMPITRKEEIRDEQEKEYIKALNNAWMKDPNSQMNDEQYEGDSLNSRR